MHQRCYGPETPPAFSRRLLAARLAFDFETNGSPEEATICRALAFAGQRQSLPEASQRGRDGGLVARDSAVPHAAGGCCSTAGASPTSRMPSPVLNCGGVVVASASSSCSRSAQAMDLLAALDPGDRPTFAVAFLGGRRRGEIVGLRVEDVDLAAGVIRVERGWDAVEGEGPPKSVQGRRTVPIAAVLRDYLVDQRLAVGGDGRLFGSPGQVRRPAEKAGRTWNKQELPRLILRDCRHCFASFMIDAGVNVNALSTFMGHANIGVTLDVYGHLLPGSEAEAASLLDDYLGRAVGGSTVAPTVAQGAEAAC